MTIVALKSIEFCGNLMAEALTNCCFYTFQAFKILTSILIWN